MQKTAKAKALEGIQELDNTTLTAGEFFSSVAKIVTTDQYGVQKPVTEVVDKSPKFTFVPEKVADVTITNNGTVEAKVTLKDEVEEAAVTVKVTIDGITKDIKVKLTAQTEEVMSDAAKLTADKNLIEAGTYEIPLANQTTQEEKTTWVQNAVNALIGNGTTATVTWNNEGSKYDVALKLGTETGSATITVTEKIE